MSWLVETTTWYFQVVCGLVIYALEDQWEEWPAQIRGPSALTLHDWPISSWVDIESAAEAKDPGLIPGWLAQIKDFKIGIRNFRVWHSAIKETV